MVTAGSSGAFLLAFTALFDAGDRVGMGEPGYPSYRQILKALSLVPVGVQSRPENRLQPVPEDFAGLDLQGLIVASPGNPSGTMLTRAALGDLIGFADQRRLRLCLGRDLSRAALWRRGRFRRWRSATRSMW